MKKKQEMDIVFLLDRSGSMRGIEQDTIGGYNSYIESQKNNDVKVTTVLFDDKYEVITNREDIKNIKELTNETYYVRGCTALLDAIGKTINYIDSQKSKKVMFIITTDGLENASKEYNRNQIKELIEGHTNWEFMYIGADIDSYSEGSSIGIKRDNISSYKKDRKGVDKLFKAMSNVSDMFYEEKCIVIEKGHFYDRIDNFTDRTDRTERHFCLCGNCRSFHKRNQAGAHGRAGQ